jgi:hypothetical protein
MESTLMYSRQAIQREEVGTSQWDCKNVIFKEEQDRPEIDLEPNII